jgi:hypothetical protein
VIMRCLVRAIAHIKGGDKMSMEQKWNEDWWLAGRSRRNSKKNLLHYQFVHHVSQSPRGFMERIQGLTAWDMLRPRKSNNSLRGETW